MIYVYGKVVRLLFFLFGGAFDFVPRGDSLDAGAEVCWIRGGCYASHRHRKRCTKACCAVVALRLQLKYCSQRPIRVSIIHVRDFMGFSRILLPMLTANFFYLHAASNKIRLGLDCRLISAGENGELMVVFVT